MSEESNNSKEFNRNPDALLRQVFKNGSRLSESYIHTGDSEDWHNLDVPVGQKATGGTSETPVSYDGIHADCGQTTDSGISERVFGYGSKRKYR